MDSATIKKDILTKQSFEIQQKLDKKLNKEMVELKRKIALFENQNRGLKSKIDTMTLTGFNKTAQLKEREDEYNSVIKELRVLKQELDNKVDLESKLVQERGYYKERYPNYVYVSNKVMDEIRDKYKLIEGLPSMYTKDIPQRNSNDLAEFMEVVDRENDFNQFMQIYTYSITSGIRLFHLIDYSKYQHSYWSSVRHLQDGVVGRACDDRGAIGMYLKYSFNNLKVTAPIMHFKQLSVEIGDKSVDVTKFNIESNKIEFKEDIKMDEIFSDQELKAYYESLDPIISLQMDHGHLIITAWDKEEFIPEIQHPFKLN